MVIQGTWNDIPLYQLPYFGPEEVEACKEKRLGGIDKPQDLLRVDAKSLMRIVDILEFNSEQLHDIAEVQKRVFSVTPSLSYKIIPKNLDPADTSLYCGSVATLEVRIRARYDPSFEETAREVENPTPELLESLKVNPRKGAAIHYRNPPKSNSAANNSNSNSAAPEEKKEATPLTQYVHAPYFCEHRLERWWLLFAEASKGILVGVEATELPDVIEGEGELVKKIEFQVPPTPKLWQFSLSLICESYFGRDVQIRIPINAKKLDEETLKKMKVPGDDDVAGDDDDDDYDDDDYSGSESDESDAEEEEEEDNEDGSDESDEEEDEDDEEGMKDDEEVNKKKKKKAKK